MTEGALDEDKESEKIGKKSSPKLRGTGRKPDAVRIQDDDGRILVVTEEDVEALKKITDSGSISPRATPRKRTSDEITGEDGDFSDGALLPLHRDDEVEDMLFDDFDEESHEKQYEYPDNSMTQEQLKAFLWKGAKKLKYSSFE